MTQSISKINQRLGRRRAGQLLLLAFAAMYALAYRFNSMCPGNKPAHPRGWWDWVDQALCLKSAEGLARFSLDPSYHHFPLGYPFLGALFWRWMPVHPFFVPDLLLATGSVWLLWRIGTRLLSPLQTLVFMVVFMAAHASLLAKTNIIPWSTLPTQFALLAGLDLALQPGSRRNVLLTALAAAGAYLVRPADCLPFVPLLLHAVLRLPGWRVRALAGACGAAVVSGALLLTCALHFAMFGTPGSPYETASLHAIGFCSYPLAEKFYVLCIDPSFFFLEKTPGLLFRYPWLFLAVPGLAYWIAVEGRAALAGALAMAASWLLYFNYNDFLPSDIYRYNLIHYLAWSFPVLALIATAAIIRGWKTRAVRVSLSIAMALGVFCSGLRLTESPLPAPTHDAEGWRIPVRRSITVHLPEAASANLTPLSLDGRALTEYMDYLKPEAPGSARWWLGWRAPGTHLVFSRATKTPTVFEFRWGWSIPSDRLNEFLR